MKLYVASLALVMVAAAGCNDELGSESPDVEAQTSTDPVTIGGYFLDQLASQQTALWTKSNWANGDSMFNCGWRPDHVYFSGDSMYLKLSDVDSSGKPFSSGEYKSNALYKYGKAETQMVPVKQKGVVSSFFTYTDSGDGNPWDEIDIEFVGDKTTQVQFNYFKNGVGHHEHIHYLGFDASVSVHYYAIVWASNKITWQVDGKDVYTVWGDTNSLPSHPMHLFANMWNAKGVDGWTGTFTYQGVRTARYDWIQFFPQ